MTTRTTIITEVKKFDIVALGQVITGHGYSYDIPKIVWACEENWESDEKCNELLELAKEEWKAKRNENPWGTTDNPPELRVYWQIIEKKPLDK
jgi:hypothetical protein